MTTPHPADFAFFIDHETGDPLLNIDTRICLHSACELLSDALDEERTFARKRGHPLPWAEGGASWFEDAFPPVQLQHIGWREIYALHLSFLTVVFKLGQEEIGTPVLSNTYEELAMRLILERAAAFLEEIADYDDDGLASLGFDPTKVDLGDVREYAFEDLDHEMLFMARLDGIENDRATAAEMGLGMLQRSQWLTPFGSALHRPHPLLWGRPARPTPTELH